MKHIQFSIALCSLIILSTGCGVRVDLLGNNGSNRIRSGGGSAASGPTSDEPTSDGPSQTFYLLDGFTTPSNPGIGFVAPSINVTQTRADFTFTAQTQVGASQITQPLPDTNKRVIGFKIHNPSAGVVGGLALMNTNINWASALGAFGSFGGNAVGLFGNANIHHVGGSLYDWGGVSTSPNIGYVFDTSDLVDGDVAVLYVDGTSWYGYVHGMLSPDLSSQVNNQALPISANLITVVATTTNAGVTSGSIGVEMIISRDEFIAAGIDPNDFPDGAQTLLNEPLK